MSLFDSNSSSTKPEVGSYIGLDANTTFTPGDPGLFQQLMQLESPLPWLDDDSFTKNEAFWKPIDIDFKRWNKLYPYRLLVVNVEKAGAVPIVGGISQATGSFSSGTPESGIEYLITQEATVGNWEMILPITPQQLQIKDDYAIQTSATMRGIVEEHNGVKFKTIVASGTTGIWPKRPTKGGSLKQPTSIASGIFSGAIESFGNFTKGIERIGRTADGKNPNRTERPANPTDENNSGAGEFSTGYYQAMYLGQFIERYVQAKKNPKNKSWRLVFDIPKQNQSFIVTPVSFEMKQNNQKPNEMLFSFQLKAWKRIDLKQNISPASAELPKLDVNEFQKIVNTITEVRRTLSRAVNLVKAVRSDFRKPFNVLRQATLAVKDLSGLVFAVAELPNQVIGDFKEALKDSISNSLEAFVKPTDRLRDSAGIGTLLNKVINIKSTSPAEKAGIAAKSISQSKIINEGLSDDAVIAGALGDEAAQRLDTDPINDVFANPEENFELFNTISIDDLVLTPEQQDAIDDELERVRLLTVDDFREMKTVLLSLALDISNNFGAGDTTYSDVYGLPDPRTRATPMTTDENEVLAAIFEAIQAYDLLTSTKQYDDFNIESPLEYVGGLANDAGIDFEDFSSKLLVPVPFGLTIEEIAARYMGDTDKYLEIVTLNKLRSPYIDEDGFSYNFLSNAEDRRFTVNDTGDLLYIGQKIILQSDTVNVFTRKIIDVEKIGEGNFLVTIDGLSDLDNLKTTDNARMQGYLPGTVNSQNQIYIPVNQPSEADDRSFNIAGLGDENLTKLSKIDFLLTDSFDIALNSVGDFRLANGLTNLIQALKLKISTQKGTLLRHLDYGIGLNPGVSVADIEAGSIVKSLNEMIKGDSRFSSVDSVTMTLKGSTLAVDMVISVANGNGIIPINFDVKVA